MDRFRLAILLLILISCQSRTENVTRELEDGSVIKYALKDGVQEGYFQSFYPEGALRSEMNFEAGLIVGEAKYYDGEGNLSAIETYEKGMMKHITQYHPSGKVSVDAGRESEALNGSYYQISERGDTLVTAFYKEDTTMYYKAYDHEGPVLDHYVDYSISTQEGGADTLLLKMKYPSPDPNLRWGVILGPLNPNEEQNIEFGKNMVNLSLEAANVGTFKVVRNSIPNDKLSGFLLEYDRSRGITFRTPFEYPL